MKEMCKIGFCFLLRELIISHNHFYHLFRHLYLNNNQLSGTISPSIDNLNLAEQIYLGQNSFDGTIPSNIGSTRPNNWRFFSLHANKLTGTIPENMKLKKLYQLDLSNNRLYGTIPEDIVHDNYSTLRLLYLNNNALDGTIPANLMQMRKLKAMYFNDNRKFSVLESYGENELYLDQMSALISPIIFNHISYALCCHVHISFFQG